MKTEPPPPSVKFVGLAILGGAGLGLVIVGVTTAFGWRMLVPGFVALLVSLGGLWFIAQSRDHTLR